MYSFAQRPDTVVLDEPLYAHYLANQPTDAVHPGREEILASQENDGEQVVENLLFGDFGKPLLICKQMTHHLVNLNLDFVFQMQNVLLIRDPRAILASFAKVIEQPTALDIGLPQQWRLYEILKQRRRPLIIVDATRLRQDPEDQLSQLCHRLGFNFDLDMLQWEAGPRSEDGVWAKYWYAGVHQSTGFKPPEPRELNLTTAQEKIAGQYEPIYRALLEKAI